MQPARVETYLKEDQVQARLKAAGARYVEDKSKYNKYVYWIGKTKDWATVERSYNGSFVLSFYSSCPC